MIEAMLIGSSDSGNTGGCSGENMSQIGITNSGSLENAEAIAISDDGKFAFSAGTRSSVALLSFDISDPTTMSKIQEYDAGFGNEQDPTALLYSDDIVYGIFGYDKFGAVDVSNPGNMSRISSIFVGSIEHSNYMTKNDNTVFVSGYDDSTLYVIDVTDPANMNNIGSVATSGIDGELYAIAGTDVLGDVLYAAATNFITAIDISNLANPTIINSLNNSTLNYSKELIIKNNFAFIVTGTGKFASVEISDPNNMTIVDSLIIDGNDVMHMRICGDTAFYIDGVLNKIYSIDISNPYALSKISEYFNENAFKGTSGQDLQIFDGVAFTVANDISGNLTSINVS